MSLSKIHIVVVTLIIASLVLSGFPANPTRAAGPATFTLNAASTYLYSGPSKSTSRVLSIFKGQSYGVLGRSADSAWLKLSLGIDAWVQTNTGTLSVELIALPVVEGSSPAVAAATPNPGSAGGGSTGVVLPPTKYTYTITAASTYVRSGPARSNSAA